MQEKNYQVRTWEGMYLQLCKKHCHEDRGSHGIHTCRWRTKTTESSFLHVRHDDHIWYRIFPSLWYTCPLLYFQTLPNWSSLYWFLGGLTIPSIIEPQRDSSLLDSIWDSMLVILLLTDFFASSINNNNDYLFCHCFLAVLRKKNWTRWINKKLQKLI